jgi:hypothetical protein
LGQNLKLPHCDSNDWFTSISGHKTADSEQAITAEIESRLNRAQWHRRDAEIDRARKLL